MNVGNIISIFQLFSYPLSQFQIKAGIWTHKPGIWALKLEEDPWGLWAPAACRLYKSKILNPHERSQKPAACNCSWATYAVGREVSWVGFLVCPPESVTELWPQHPRKEAKVTAALGSPPLRYKSPSPECCACCWHDGKHW